MEAKISSGLRFSPSLLHALASNKILGIRAGKEHRFTGVWVVVANGRVFIRSWNNKTSGWFQAFLKDRSGAMQVGKRRLRVHVRFPRGEKLLDSIDKAYAEKYTTRASRKYVLGFARPHRRKTTMELLPAR